MKREFRKILCLLMAMALVAVLLPQAMVEAEADSPSLATLLEGKTLSVLGDSISTYNGVSNGAAAQTSNSTIANNWYYYPALSVTDPSYTWWMQTVDTLGMDLLVNNAWSGSYLLKENGTLGAYADRCVQLHDDTGDNAGQTPDIIAFYLGTNDVTHDKDNVGTFDAINFDTLITGSAGAYTYATPTTSMEAYAICLHKISQRYPDAEVYCFTLLPAKGSAAQPTAFNADVKKLANKFGCYVVDLYNDSGIISEPAAFNIMMDGNALHPGQKGMDAMTNAFVSAILKNSKYVPQGTSVYNVSYDLGDVMSLQGTPKAVLGGTALALELDTYFSYSTLDKVTVTMGGKDVTADCYENGVISIEAVTGDVTITATTTESLMEHEHNCEHCGDSKWMEWTGNVEDLYNGGHFCLTKDITISQNVKLHAGQEVVICLGGHTITSEVDRLFWLTEGSRLTIVDCTAKTDAEGNYTAGTIYAKLNNNAGTKGMVVGLYAGTNGLFEMYDGIIDGRSGNNARAQFGGLIDMYSSSTVNIFGGEIRNYTSYNGGAIYAQMGTVNIENAKISGCSATNYGGAVYIENAILNIGEGTVITGCNALRGGAIASVKGKVAATGATISDCTGTTYGGVIYATGTDVDFTDTDMIGCKSQNGGAIFGNSFTETDKSLTPADVTVIGGTIKNCQATATSGDSNGGAIQTYTANIHVKNTQITGCSAVTNGGAIIANKATVDLEGVTITGNSANRGAAIFTQGGAVVNIKDTTITGNTDKYYGAVTVWAKQDVVSVRGNTQIHSNTATQSGRNSFATGVLLQNGAVLYVKNLDAAARVDVCTWEKNGEEDAPRTTGIISVLAGELDHNCITYKNADVNLCWNAENGVDGYHQRGECPVCGEVEELPDYNGLVVVDGVWGYYEGGVLQVDYTGLVPYGDILFYVENGILDFTYTGLVWHNDAWRYVANSQLTEGYTGLVWFNDNWFYTVDSVIDWTFTGLVPYEGNYFYVQNNLLDWSYTGLGYHDGGWYFIQNGLLQKEYSGLVYFNDNWFYVEEGVLTYQYFGMVEYEGNLFYVQASHLDWNYTGLGYHEGAWYYFQNALYTPSFSGLVPFDGSLFYVKDGTIDWSFNGSAEYDGIIYTVENGVAEL